MSSFEAAYLRLQEAFRERCANEARALRAMAVDGRLEGASAVALLHRLAGAAGTFGFGTLSAEAAQLEHDLRGAGSDPDRTSALFGTLDAVAAGTQAPTPLKAAFA